MLLTRVESSHLERELAPTCTEASRARNTGRRVDAPSRSPLDPLPAPSRGVDAPKSFWATTSRQSTIHLVDSRPGPSPTVDSVTRRKREISKSETRGRQAQALCDVEHVGRPATSERIRALQARVVGGGFRAGDASLGTKRADWILDEVSASP
eukprot:4155955-Pyramimonas_sp.AAC.1